MSKPRVVSVDRDTRSFCYQVETTWPSRTDGRFGEYYASSYSSTDHPGEMLIRSRPDLFGEGCIDECRFTEYEPARRLAEYLREKGRFMTAYEGPEPWRGKYAGPIDSRVVLVATRTTRHVLES